MEAALRPHRGGTVLALGIVSLIVALFLVPLGIVAWILGSKDLKAMDRGDVDPAGRSLTQIGQVFGITASLMWVGTAGCTALMTFATVRTSSSFAGNDGVRHTRTYYSHALSEGPQKQVEWEYQEVERPNGAVVKEGPAIHWSRDGKKLEEGSYRDGKRDGPWTFRHEDGSIDQERSGVYQDDEKIGPSPMGDFPTDESR